MVIQQTNKAFGNQIRADLALQICVNPKFQRLVVNENSPVILSSSIRLLLRQIHKKEIWQGVEFSGDPHRCGIYLVTKRFLRLVLLVDILDILFSEFLKSKYLVPK